MILFLVSAFYIGWLLITCVSQPLFFTTNWISRYDVLRLIPIWTFFAPNPGVSDFNLLSRFKLQDGTITTFDEIPLRGPKKISTALFNPHRRLQKALHDHARSVVMQIETELTDENRDNIKLTFSYISLLSYCAELPAPADAHFIQFIILESFGYQPLTDTRLIINSEFHKL